MLWLYIYIDNRFIDIKNISLALENQITVMRIENKKQLQCFAIVLIKDIDNQDFVRYNSNIISSIGKSSNKDTKSSGKDKNEQKDIVQRTYVFYSNKSIDEIEAARQLKKTERDIAEGFA